MRRRRPTALLLDFDGVLRHFDAGVAAAIEARSGLEPGTILAIGLAPDRVVPAVLGQVGRAGWLESIVEELILRGGDPGAASASVAEWDAHRGVIDAQVLSLIGELRADGVPVALCSNATDDLRNDLALFDLAEAFDAVISSAEIGVAKPHPEFYATACAALATAPADCLLVDDTRRNIAGARAAGLVAFRYSGVADLAYLRGIFAHR
jgi:putative hydrolase of the HAD superfamily